VVEGLEYVTKKIVRRATSVDIASTSNLGSLREILSKDWSLRTHRGNIANDDLPSAAIGRATTITNAAGSPRGTTVRHPSQPVFGLSALIENCFLNEEEILTPWSSFFF
jgi:hypothetical protein